ncbi:MAG: HNH endonuclease [Candidatus Roizmanbacteria bacterium]|nr:HNH endonuclease [Candidatus Roizmanbacteria bacterium]
MKFIYLTNHPDMVIVDDEDFEYLNQWKWCSSIGRLKQNHYAIRTTHTKEIYTIAMHRLLCKAPKGMYVDHINNNTLDNRRSNLRIVTASENQRNLKKKKVITSYFPHVGGYDKWSIVYKTIQKVKNLIFEILLLAITRLILQGSVGCYLPCYFFYNNLDRGLERSFLEALQNRRPFFYGALYLIGNAYKIADTFFTPIRPLLHTTSLFLYPPSNS